MPIRTVTGVIRQPLSGQPWAGAEVEIRHMGPPWVASDGIYPQQSQSLTANEAGEVSVWLAVPDEGAARYGLWLPGAKREIPFALAACQDDEPVRLEDVLEMALVAIGHMALPTRIPEPASDGLFARLRSSGIGSWLAATSVGSALFAAVDAAAARGAIGAASASDLTTHTGATGAGVHGAGAAGAALLATATQDAARAELGLAALALPPRQTEHHNAFAYANVNVVGSGGGNAGNNRTNVFSGTTANSFVRRQPNTTALFLSPGYSGYKWSRFLIFSIAYFIATPNVEGVARVIFGKNTAAANGIPATGNYLAVTIENTTPVSGTVCKAGTLETVVFSPVPPGSAHITILSNAGTVLWYANGLIVGQTINGPSVDAAGGIMYELENGATAANYAVEFYTSSMGYY